MKNNRVCPISIIIFLGLIFADQLSKFMIHHSGGSYFCNPNLAFSIPISRYLFIPLWCILVILIILHIFRKIRQSSIFGWQMFFPVLVLAGAFSNLLDRMIWGCVIDFINLARLWPANIAGQNIPSWPTFNLADSFITIGILGIIILYFLRRD